MLVARGLPMAGGTAGVLLVAAAAGAQVGAWTLVPGLVVGGAGPGLRVVPLVDVVAAVPSDAAGGASGVFATCQQLGGVLGVALLGTVFSSHGPSAALTGAFEAAAPIAAIPFAACAVLALALPRTAVAETYD